MSFHGTILLRIETHVRHVLCSHIDALYLISNTAALIPSSRRCRLDALSSERDPVSSLPVYAGTWPTYQSDFCLGGVAQLLRWCVAESGRGEGSRAVEATTVLWTEPFVPSGHSSSVKCSVSYHGTNSAPSSRPRDRHVLCSHIDALYLND